MSANKQFKSAGLRRFNARTLPATIFRKCSHETIDDHKRIIRHSTRKAIDARHTDSIAAAIPYLPAAGETWHIIAKGNTPLWLTIPRLYELSAEPIARLRISTLGFGRDFALYLREATTAKAIQDFGIVCSHYFRSTSEQEYDILAAFAGQRLAVTRCHAKVISAVMQSGRAFVIEGSGNLRSCRSIEQMIITQDAELAAFHAAWIDELLNGTPPDTAIRPIGDNEPTGGHSTRPANRPS